MGDLEKYSYLAGLFDGEGSFTINIVKAKPGRQSASFNCQLYISNTSKKLMEWLMSNFNGGLVKIKRNPGKNQRVCYRFYFRKKGRIKLVEDILPSLVVKRKHAELFLKYSYLMEKNRKRDCSIKLSPEEFNERKEIYLELKPLNRRGLFYD